MALREGALRVVVCGTKFGRVYLSALREPGPFQLAAILARGSARSQACAQSHGVPLLTRVDELPDDIDLACVVVGGGLAGGPGTELAKALLCRGVHVLQEHPMHHDELAACVRTAAQHGTVHYLNTLYPHVRAVRRFIAVSRALAARQPPLFVDGSCALQVKYAFFDIVCRALGQVKPFAFAPVGDPVGELGCEVASPFCELRGTIGGVPVNVRVQNEVHAHDPDNHAHVYHRVTIGFEGGNLLLADTHGPVLWCPRPHIPVEVQCGVDPAESRAPSLDHPSASILGDVAAPTWREIMTAEWPGAVRRALGELCELLGRGSGAAHGQYHLTLTRLVAEVNARCGAPRVIRGAAPVPLGAEHALRALADAPAGS
jgi:thiazolinyl imide reductase